MTESPSVPPGRSPWYATMPVFATFGRPTRALTAVGADRLVVLAGKLPSTTPGARTRTQAFEVRYPGALSSTSALSLTIPSFPRM